MIKVWTDCLESGHMGRRGERGSVFTYTASAEPARAVSLTMPMQLESWTTPFGLAPIFEMNLPEGALREDLRLRFAKSTTGRFDNYDLLTVVSRSQLGRIRYTEEGANLDEAVPFQSVEEILAGQGGIDLYRDLLQRFAPVSGISGVQPKVLIRDPTAVTPEFQPSFSSATHIVKLWSEHDYPQLAANEYFCLRAAERSGLEVPRFRLAQDGRALVLDRFDLAPDGTYLGFEDFCVLNARGTEEKYKGSYETAIFKRFRDFSGGEQVAEGLERLFTLLVLNCALRNGDAHLKNFALLYDDVLGPARLAPAYDLVTTTAYLPLDTMALTLNGKKTWPDTKTLQRFGEVQAGLTPARTRAVFERVQTALAETTPELSRYAREHPAFTQIGARMLQQWQWKAGADVRA